MVTLKISRFNKYIQRAVEKDLLKIRKSDFYIAIFPDFTPITILRPKVKKPAALFINNNERALAKVYTITSRRLKDKVKIRINSEKFLKIIISI